MLSGISASTREPVARRITCDAQSSFGMALTTTAAKQFNICCQAQRSPKA